MKLVTETPYKCDQCGKIGLWVKGQWVAWICFFKGGYSGWEHEFHLCSEDCYQQIIKTPKKELQKLAYNKNK